MITRSPLISVRVPDSYLDEIESSLAADSFPYSTVSECLREGGILLVRAIRYREMLKDKGKEDEMSKRLDNLLRTENVDKFTESVPDEMLAIIASAVDKERLRRRNHPKDQKLFI